MAAIFVTVTVLVPQTVTEPPQCQANARPGVNWHNCSLEARDLSRVDLSASDLRNAKLRDATLMGARLSQSNLAYADLVNTNISYADLSGARLDWGKLAACGPELCQLCRAPTSRTPT